MKSIWVLALLCAGCATTSPQPKPVSALSAIDPPTRSSLQMSSVAVTIPFSATNTITLGWTASTSPGVIGYRLYYGSNTNTTLFLSGLPVSTNCAFNSVVQIYRNGTNVTRIRTFPDGRSWTNVIFFWFSMTATNATAESVPCAPTSWPSVTPQGPPPNAIELNWGRVTSVAVRASQDLFSWQTVTNVVGSNVVLRMTQPNQDFILLSPPPALTNHARSLYIP